MSRNYDEKYFASVRRKVHSLKGTPTPSGCIEWRGYLDDNGYGIISFMGKNCLAHRLVWRLEYGAFPQLLLCHHCDNPSCVNLEHLFEGTQSDNMADCARKGRAKHDYYVRGEKHGMAKLDSEKVVAIRTLKPTHSRRKLARMFGVTPQLITEVVRRRIWKHVPDTKTSETSAPSMAGPVLA